MPKKHSIYWYRTHPAVAKAFLYHCRDRDLREGDGIPQGSIVQGVGGFAVAESSVPNLTGSIIPTFQPNRQCEWMGFTLPCMAHPQAPTGTATKQEFRPFNYIVAELSDSAAITEAQTLGVPVVTHSSGKHLANLEISSFERQGKSSPRRARLL